jgi:TolB-like protein
MRGLKGSGTWERLGRVSGLAFFAFSLCACGSAETGAIGDVDPPEPVIVTFEDTYGGAGSDVGYAVVQTADGGFVIAGTTKSSGVGSTSDVYLIKTDADGAVIWQKSFGEAENDSAFGLQATSDGGFIIVGETYSFGAGTHADVYLVRTDAEGGLLWQKTFGGDEEDSGYDVKPTADGGFIVAGRTWSFGAGVHPDAYLLKVDPDGNLLWQKTFGEADEDAAYSVQIAADGGFILAGETFSFGADVYSDLYLVRTDAGGGLLWQRTFGGGQNDCGFSVARTADGGFVIAGETYSFGAGVFSDAYLVKTDSEGNLIWQSTFGDQQEDAFRFVLPTEGGGYLMAGGTFSFGAGVYPDIYLLKADPAGGLEWQKRYGGGRTDFGYGLAVTEDGGIVVAGESNSFDSGIYPDVYLVKTDGEGNLD